MKHQDFNTRRKKITFHLKWYLHNTSEPIRTRSEIGAHAPESWRSVLSLPQILEITTDPWNCKQQHPHMPVCEGLREPWTFWNRYFFVEHACILPLICHRPPIPLGICRFPPLHRTVTESFATKQLHATMLFYMQPLFLSIFRVHMWSARLDTSFKLYTYRSSPFLVL